MSIIEDGMLYVVSTPIGNLEDITFRAVRTLKEADIIAAEDTRHSGLLLKHLGINAKLTSYHDFNKEEKAPVLIEYMKKGSKVALISDAGTPNISDPGFHLISRCIEAKIRIVPIPGVCAAIAALSVSGLPTHSFSFHGFLPVKKNKKISMIQELAALNQTVIIYESPHRTEKTLRQMLEVMGDRSATVARELTKLHEEVIRGRLSEIITRIEGRTVKGEVTIIVGAEAE